MRIDGNIRKLVRESCVRLDRCVDQNILEDAFSCLETVKSKSTAESQPTLLWRTIMRSPMIKGMIAAIVVVIVLIGMDLFDDQGTGVVWGEVVSNIETNPGFTFQHKQTNIGSKTGTLEINMKVYGSPEYGVRVENDDSRLQVESIGNRQREVLILINHIDKTYSRTRLTSDQVAELEKVEPKDYVRALLSTGYDTLGRKTINGIEAEGVGMDDPAGANISSDVPIEINSHKAELWVAVDTGLPVLFKSTTHYNGNKTIHSIHKNFQWNVELDPGLFDPEIPSDYTLIEQ